MNNYKVGQKVTLTKTCIINNRKYVGKPATVDLVMEYDMVWIKVGRKMICTHTDNIDLM